MKSSFKQQLEQSMFIHFPLECDESKSMEEKYRRKKVLRRQNLWDGGTLARWRFDGDGAAEAKDGALVMRSDARSDHWPGSEVRSVDASNGLYATFGSYEAKLDVKGMDLSWANRLSFRIRPLCKGWHSPIVRPAFVNNGAIKIPDAYSREGFNAMNLKNFEWNLCHWEIGSIAHDKIEEVSFIMHRYGRELSGGEKLVFEITDICFEAVEKTSVVHGWQCEEENAVFSTTGYFCSGTKTAVANTAAQEFSLVDASTGVPALTKPVQRAENSLGSFSVLDFSEITQRGEYFLAFGNTRTPAFCIDDEVMETTVWKLVNFLFCERCGYPVPGKHGVCHSDIVARHNGVALVANGGWHDAADVSQESVQSGETVDALLEAAESVKADNALLFRRLLEEANWGLDYVLKTRFGDGFRSTGYSIRRWTDGLIGNMDDCDARVTNNSFVNFQMAAVEASAGSAFRNIDPALAWKCRSAAKEDFEFAEGRFDEHGVEALRDGEHATGSARSHYYAAACLAASRIYAATGEECYAESAKRYAEKVMICQEDGSKGLPMKGFFYRDETKERIVHSSHQSRDQLFVQALTAACELLPACPEKKRWEASMRLHGEYLKGLMGYTAPFGMIPAGMFQISEADDRPTFELIHPKVDFTRERANYIEQLHNGEDIGSGCFVRRFPVWFSYRGNSGILLSMGKAASLLGCYFHDEALLQIAREQLYWTLGKNPFGQSLIYGEGENFGQQYAALLGESVGELAVGVQTRGNEDIPYWPQGCIATYREVWTTPPTRWLWIFADLWKK